MLWCMLLSVFGSVFSLGLQSYQDLIPIYPGHNTDRSIPSETFMYLVTHKDYPSLYSEYINSSLTLTGLSQNPLFRLDYIARADYELERRCVDFINITNVYWRQGPICGSIVSEVALHFTAMGDDVTFTFVTDESSGYFGVVLNFTAIFPIHLDNNTDRSVPSESLMYIATHKFYPELYDININSSLTLTNIPPNSTIRLDFLARAGVEIEPRCLDSVIVSGVDGYENNEMEICGNDFGQTTLSFNLIEPRLTFRFISDNGYSLTGFVMKYSATPQTNKLKASTSSTVRMADLTMAATIAGIVTASALLVIAAILAVIVALLRKQLKRRAEKYAHVEPMTAPPSVSSAQDICLTSYAKTEEDEMFVYDYPRRIESKRITGQRVSMMKS
ncbi:uncharacterized protein [Watersipora subatra]|uniref:uncharacterized protein isoform X2 n=1 Tax=Watersipora subatra TaxID=2589382 RepID=UPI00355B42B6